MRSGCSSRRSTRPSRGAGNAQAGRRDAAREWSKPIAASRRSCAREQRAGGSPDEQIVESLGKISTEIDQVTRQLAAGALDDLAIRTRYLDYKYGDAEA